MQRKALFFILISLFALNFGLGQAQASNSADLQPLAASPAGTAFTYQGQLVLDDAPVNSTCEFTFSLWDDPGAGKQIGSDVTLSNIAISDGLFTVSIDFGTDVFTGDARWLEIFVDCNILGQSATLWPRQPLTPAPYSIRSESAADADTLDGEYASAFADASHAHSPIDIVPQGGNSGLDADFLDGQDSSAFAGASHNHDSVYWSLTGNAGTTPGTDFLGTTDDQALELHVNGSRALRLEPSATSPNVIVGHNANTITTDRVGGAIGGGGDVTSPNRVYDNFGTIGGGLGHRVGLDGAAGNSGATVGGGMHNTASSLASTVGGGQQNTAGGDNATVPGGLHNSASGDFSFAAGRRAKATNQGTFVWADSTDTDFVSTADDQFNVRASGGVRFETGGAGMQVDGNEFWHAGNDGTGSSLDADLLDGKEAYEVSDFLHRAAAPAANNITNYYFSGTDASATIGVDGLGLISFGDSSAGLIVAHCENVACTSATFTTLDEGTGVVSTSIAIGSDGLGLISYFDASNSNLKLAHCNDIACTSAYIGTITLSGSGDVKDHSLTIGSDGLGLIVFVHGSNLNVAHCSTLECNVRTFSTLWTGTTSGYISITTGSDGLGLISYHDIVGDTLTVAHCVNITCSSSTFTALNSSGDGGAHNSITIGTDGLGLISFADSSLTVAHCSNIACTSATFSSDAGSAMYTSITTGADGLGLVSYYDSSNDDLRMAHCNDLACSTVTSYPLDGAGDVGRYSSVTIGVDGLPLVGYFTYSPIDFKMAHCSNPFCTPYFRRR